MMTSRQQPLEIAAKVLKASTIAGVRRSPSFHVQAWKILDRWAYNSPTQLRALESQGETILLERLLRQQQIEQKAISQATAQLTEGMAEHEILQLYGIQTEL